MARRGKAIPVPIRLRVKQLAADSERVIVAAIARELGLSRNTVYKYMRQKTCQQV